MKVVSGDESSKRHECRFKSSFGVSEKNCAIVWVSVGIEFEYSNNCAMEHLLWALCLLSTYDTEENLSAKFGGVDEKTFRKWSWLFIHLISGLQDYTVSL